MLSFVVSSATINYLEIAKKYDVDWTVIRRIARQYKIEEVKTSINFQKLQENLEKLRAQS